MKRIPAAIAAIVLVAANAAKAQWTGAPSPHDGEHLVVVRAAGFQGEGGGKADVSPAPGALIGGAAARVSEPIVANFEAKHAGRYVVWVRVGAAKSRTPLAVSLRQGQSTILKATVNRGEGTIETGGPAGFKAYATLAQASAPGGKEGAEFDADANPGAEQKAAAEGAAELIEELAADAGESDSSGKWIHATRLEEPTGERPFYWWKAGEAELEAGKYDLRLQGIADGKSSKPRPNAWPLVDAVLLSTSQGLTYPYAGDIDAPPASYVRFRIDGLPKKGLSIGASMRVHYDPWSTAAVWLNPAGMSAAQRELHTRTGYTRWYRLQDIERAPAFGGGEAQLHLQLTGGDANAKHSGVTQFAVYPHQDYVLREIDWAEPGGLNVSLAPDFASYLHQLRTLRDQAREDYEKALEATGGRVFPLTRDGLYLGNAWGAATGEAHEYMAQTLRLLGFNCVGEAEDPVRSRELYGWTSHGGQYWPPAHLPIDEQAASREYEDYYRDFFTPQKEFYEGVSVFQVADEPGEISRSEMSSPLWRFAGAGDELKWTDATGNSELYTRRADYGDCVLEGKLEQHGGWVGFRVRVDSGEKPARYAWWHVGQVSQNRLHNLAVGRAGLGKETSAALTRKGAVIQKTPTPFKIVCDGGMAALYLNGVLVNQQIDLPETGGFGIVGDKKAICELRFRPIAKKERLSAEVPDQTDEPDASAALDDVGGDDLEDLLGGAAELPEWATPKTLEEMVRQDWMPGGGMPEAHAGFRAWAQTQELTPETFGKESWDDVRMLTVASLVETPEEARLFYWSRRYSGYLTPRMFGLAAESIRRHAPNPNMLGFVALSGHSLYFPSETPLDMFQLASDPAVMPGISDWMSYGGWRWDCHHAVAFSMAFSNAGARRYGQAPANFPMMHCVWPSEFRAYTMLANQARYVSYYNFGPAYAVTEGYWSDSPGCYQAVHATNNRVAQVDDVLAHSQMRPSRVAMLYSMSNEYWNPQASFADKRAAFLGLAHEYYQPELVTEDQVLSGALANYDALYVLDPIVATAAQDKIADWTRSGGLLWTCADALTRNEFNEPCDLLSQSAGMRRVFAEVSAADGSAGAPAGQLVVSPAKGQADFRPHAAPLTGVPVNVESKKARVRAKYADGRPAWLELPLGKGRVVYLGHRCGLAYTGQAIRRGGYPTIWADTGRATLVTSLSEAKIERELILNQPLVMASALSTDEGTVIVLHNMHAAPCKQLEISLKEPAAPASVEYFEGTDRRPLQYEYRDGRVWMTLPELTAGQMLLVRRQPAPTDDRLAEMKARTEQQLESSDARALTVGSWFAGFHPEWELGSKLVPLLAHPQWEARRAAAEALGRLGSEGAAEAILAALAQESDAHVVGDELFALATLGHPGTGELCLDHLRRQSAFVRQQAARSIGVLLERDPADDMELVLQAAEIALADTDLRVRRQGIKLISQVDPNRALDLAAHAYAVANGNVVAADAARDPLEQPHWADAIAVHDAAFTALLTSDAEISNGLLLAVAARRADSELASRLAKRLDQLAEPDAVAVVAAAVCQRDQGLARAIFAHREKLPPTLASYLTLILEHAFDARLGDSLADWEQRLK